MMKKTFYKEGNLRSIESLAQKANAYTNSVPILFGKRRRVI